MSIRVFLVDDHEVVLRGLTGLIQGEPDLQVVGQAARVRETITRVREALPDVVVLDVRLGDGSGIDLCREIRTTLPAVHCLILTAFDDDAAATAAVLAGAAGYVLKTLRGGELIEAIRRVANGERLMDARVASRAADLAQEDIPPASPLTPRERDVVQLISVGLTNREIGERLGLTEKTVKNYVSAVLVKLGMRRRSEAAVYAARLSRPEHAPPPLDARRSGYPGGRVGTLPL